MSERRSSAASSPLDPDHRYGVGMPITDEVMFRGCRTPAAVAAAPTSVDVRH